MASFVLQHFTMQNHVECLMQTIFMDYWCAERRLYAYQDTDDGDIGPDVRSVSHTEFEC